MKNLKNLVLIIIILTIVSCSQKRNKVGHLEELNLKDNVWQIIEQPYEIEGDIESFEVLEIDKYNWEFPHKLYEFDKNGYLTKNCEIRWNGDIEECQFYKINNGKLIIESKKDTLEIKIDEEGRKAEYADSARIGEFIEYRKKGNKDIYDIKNSFLKRNYLIQNHLNNNGQITKQVEIDSIGNEKIIYEIEYNENYDVSIFKEYSFESDSVIRERKYKYLYDNQNNWIQKVVFENDELLVAVKRKIYYYEDCFKEFKKEDLIGMWKRNRSERWIEFFKNGKIDIGRGSSIRESGTWELDEKTKRITFRIEDGGTKYDYRFSECNLILIDPTDQSDFDTYKKVDSK